MPVRSAARTSRRRVAWTSSGSQKCHSASVTAGDPNLADTVLDDSTLDALLKTAKQNGTYYSSTTAGKMSCRLDATQAVIC